MLLVELSEIVKPCDSQIGTVLVAKGHLVIQIRGHLAIVLVLFDFHTVFDDLEEPGVKLLDLWSEILGKFAHGGLRQRELPPHWSKKEFPPLQCPPAQFEGWYAQ